MNREIREEIGGRGEMINERVEELERNDGRKVGDDIWKREEEERIRVEGF